MRIVSSPDPKSYSRQCTCGTCHSVLEVGIADFHRTVYDQRDGDATVFRCPVCQSDNWIGLDLIPVEFRHLLKKPMPEPLPQQIVPISRHREDIRDLFAGEWRKLAVSVGLPRERW